MDLSPKQEFTELTETQRNETKAHVTLIFFHYLLCTSDFVLCSTQVITPRVKV